MWTSFEPDVASLDPDVHGSVRPICGPVLTMMLTGPYLCFQNLESGYVVCTILIELKKAHIPQKASNSSEEEKHCDFLVKHFHDVFSMPLGVLLVMETPKDECYINCHKSL